VAGSGKLVQSPNAKIAYWRYENFKGSKQAREWFKHTSRALLSALKRVAKNSNVPLAKKLEESVGRS
jgi:hypothetical protein